MIKASRTPTSHQGAHLVGSHLHNHLLITLHCLCSAQHKLAEGKYSAQPANNNCSLSFITPKCLHEQLLSNKFNFRDDNIFVSFIGFKCLPNNFNYQERNIKSSTLKWRVVQKSFSTALHNRANKACVFLYICWKRFFLNGPNWVQHTAKFVKNWEQITDSQIVKRKNQ